MMKPIDYGKVAYDAYCEARGWKSVRGEPLPQFAEQSHELQTAWITAAAAITEAESDTITKVINGLADSLESLAKEVRGWAGEKEAK